MLPHLFTQGVALHDNGRFLVKSSTGPREYLVDVTAFGGAGSCDCLHYRCRIQPVQESTPPAELQPTR